MTEERKHALLFAATILAARKLAARHLQGIAYAPVWYLEQHHNRAVVAKRILESFVPASRKRNQQRELYFGSDR
jgi:hypothetical protein